MPTPIDRPIIISGGSPLAITSLGGWTRVNPRTIISPYSDNAVTSVEVNPESPTARFFEVRDDEPCDLCLTFGTVRLAVQTDPEGRNLRVVTLGDSLFTSHFVQEDETTLRSRDAEACIQNFTIARNGERFHVELAPGETRIVIHCGGEGASRPTSFETGSAA